MLSVLRLHVVELPAQTRLKPVPATCFGEGLAVVVLSPSWLFALLPQHQTVPSVFTAQV